MIIGILALQGNFKKHFDSFYKLNVNTIYVKTVEDLMKSDALVIPGGESTTITKLLKKNLLINPLRDYSKIKNIFGTCAGSILMSSNTNDKTIESINCINVEIKRNAWGSQIHSFNNNVIVNISQIESSIGKFYNRADLMFIIGTTSANRLISKELQVL